MEWKQLMWSLLGVMERRELHQRGWRLTSLLLLFISVHSETVVC